MTTKRVFLKQIEIPEGRYVIAYFVCAIEESETEISQSKPHTICITPDADLDTLRTNNQSSMTDMGWSDIPDSEWQRVLNICYVVHTPEVKSAYTAWKSTQK